MNSIFVGETLDKVKLTIPNIARCGHVQVVGATGRGKTESVIMPWMIQDIINHVPVILIDGKGDKEIKEKVDHIFKEYEFHDWQKAYFNIADIENSATTNPLKFGSSQQIVDRIYATFEFDNFYFKSVSYEACLLAVEVIQKSKDSEVTFKKIFTLLTQDKVFAETLSKLSSQREIELVTRASAYLAQNFKDRQEKISGFLSQAQPFAVGELSVLLNGRVERKEFFTLSEAICPISDKENLYPASNILVFIPTLLYQQTASKLGQMFLQEIAWAVSQKEKETHKQFQSIYLDEFSSFVYPGFIGLLNKARSTKTALHISHQSVADLEEVSKEFAKAIHTNTNVKCVLGVNDPETSDFFAKHFGTKRAEKTTERVKKGSWGDREHTGDMSLRETQEYRVNPNNLRMYSQGQGVLSFIYQGESICEEIQFARLPF